MKFDHTFIEGLSYKTPFFLFSREKLLKKLKEFKKNFPGASINYAVKANSELEILETLAKAGSGFEAASMYELDLLKKIGVPAKKVIYGTSIKPPTHIKNFKNYGVDVFAFDSLPELEKIATIAPGSRVYVRVAVNDSGSVFKFSEKFGTSKDNVVLFLRRAKDLGLKPYGISFHVGSQASNPMAWANAIKSLREPLVSLKKDKINIEILNIGGGYPCNYASTDDDLTLEEISRNTLREYNKLPYRPKLILEPGRGMVASTGVLVASVIGKAERSDHTWLFLDVGVYNGLFEAMAYQGSTRYQVTSVRPSYDSGEMTFALAGPTGDSPDIITREAMLPKDIEVGDKVVLHDVGAYSLVVTSLFNGFPRPKAYIL